MKIHFHRYPGELEQVIANRIHNTYMHAFEGRDFGNMHLKAEVIGENLMRLIFSDDGVGIAQEHVARIFDFFTTRLSQGGPGLGLSIVQNIVQNIVTGMLKGRREVSSSIGTSTEFLIELPLS